MSSVDFYKKARGGKH